MLLLLGAEGQMPNLGASSTRPVAPGAALGGGVGVGGGAAPGGAGGGSAGRGGSLNSDVDDGDGDGEEDDFIAFDTAPAGACSRY